MADTEKEVWTLPSWLIHIPPVDRVHSKTLKLLQEDMERRSKVAMTPGYVHKCMFLYFIQIDETKSCFRLGGFVIGLCERHVCSHKRSHTTLLNGTSAFRVLVPHDNGLEFRPINSELHDLLPEVILVLRKEAG